MELKISNPNGKTISEQMGISTERAEYLAELMDTMDERFKADGSPVKPKIWQEIASYSDTIEEFAMLLSAYTEYRYEIKNF